MHPLFAESMVKRGYMYLFVTVQSQAKFQKTGIKCLHF